MNLTDFLENMWIPLFKAAEANGNNEECLRLIEVLINALNDAKKQVN